MTFETSFQVGDVVRIIEKNKTKSVYKIKKMKKNDDGQILYLLKSENNPITLLYYENEESYLERVN